MLGIPIHLGSLFQNCWLMLSCLIYDLCRFHVPPVRPSVVIGVQRVRHQNFSRSSLSRAPWAAATTRPLVRGLILGGMKLQVLSYQEIEKLSK